MTIHKLLFPVLILVLAACQPAANPTPADAAVGLPNPASVYCEENGGQLEIRADAGGGQYGVCVFPDGSRMRRVGFFPRRVCSWQLKRNTQPWFSGATPTGQW